MEGVFYYGVGNFTKKRIEKILDEKKKTRVCSLSTNPENELMWTFYADNHRGIVIEVELDELGISDELTRVKYIKQNEFREEDGTNVDAKYLLMRKLPEWKYEKEWRVLTESEFVKVKVTGITKGERADQKTIEKLEKLIRDCNLSISIKDRKPLWLGPKN